MSGVYQDPRKASRAANGTAAGGVEPRFDAALNLLLQGANYAQDLQCDQWEFALEIGALRRAGLTTNDLRWLVCMGYIEHAEEIVRSAEERRQFRSTGKLSFTRRTCFILTPAGRTLAEQRLGESLRNGDAILTTKAPPARPHGWDVISHPDPAERPLPQWDGDRREVRVNGQVVKQFKLPSPNQEIVLMAFEEEGWPTRIDDPLPAHPSLDPKRRLHDTIRSLNRNQKERLLRFKGDGTGEGILWETVSVHDRQASNDDGHA